MYSRGWPRTHRLAQRFRENWSKAKVSLTSKFPARQGYTVLSPFCVFQEREFIQKTEKNMNTVGKNHPTGQMCDQVTSAVWLPLALGYMQQASSFPAALKLHSENKGNGNRFNQTDEQKLMNRKIFFRKKFWILLTESSKIRSLLATLLRENLFQNQTSFKKYLLSFCLPNYDTYSGFSSTNSGSNSNNHQSQEMLESLSTTVQDNNGYFRSCSVTIVYPHTTCWVSCAIWVVPGLSWHVGIRTLKTKTEASTFICTRSALSGC